MARRRVRWTAFFRELPQLLNAGDLLVFNDTKVIKARIFGEKASGGKLELLIERVLPGHQVVAHMKVSKKPLIGGQMAMAGGALATADLMPCCWAAGPMKTASLFHSAIERRTARLDGESMAWCHLPPYIERPAGAGEHADTEEDAQAVTRPCLRGHRARWLRPPPHCILTRPCWPLWTPKACNAPA